MENNARQPGSKAVLGESELRWKFGTTTLVLSEAIWLVSSYYCRSIEEMKGF